VHCIAHNANADLDHSACCLYCVLRRSYAVEFTLYTLYMVAGTGLAASITAYFAPDVAGSGIPVMKW
jgi:H+/Cl- antiporter ClcA